MIRMLGAMVGAMALSFASTASAAVIVPMIEGITYGDGIAKLRVVTGLAYRDEVYMHFAWDLGKLNDVAGELDDLVIDHQLWVTQGVVDPLASNGVRYVPVSYHAPLCTFKNGCVELVGEHEALARLVLPEWDLPCVGPAGFICSQEYHYSSTYSEVLIRYKPGRVVRGTVTLYPNSPIPEPATWAMMIAGFGLTGAALRRRMGYVSAI